MKIVVISDTHGNFDELKRVSMIENGADLYLHAGDVGHFASLDISPFAAVKGNCDFTSSLLPIERKVNTPYGILLIRHHPILFEEDLKQLYAEGVRIFVHGHTHIKEDRTFNDMRIICPGSLCFPRDDYASYAVLEIDKENVKTTFKKI